MTRLNCRMEKRVQEPTEMAIRSDGDCDGPEAGLPGV
jgi:hypothetical protein